MATQREFEAVARLLREERIFAHKAFGVNTECSALDAAEMAIEGITIALAEHYGDTYTRFDKVRFLQAARPEEV